MKTINKNIQTAHRVCLLFCGLAIFLAIAPAAMAQQQQNAPHVAYVYPAGGRQGETFQVTVGGQYLATADNAYISGGGVQIKVDEYIKPLTQKQAMELRDKVQELMKKPKDAAAVKEIAEIRKKLSTFVRMPNPVLSETVTLQVTLASDAEPGRREFRLEGANGLSNPMVFQVGQLPEQSKKEAKIGGNPMPGQPPRGPGEPRSTAPEPEINITLPTVVNGQIMPGGVDRYRFKARKGQQIIAVTSARELIPYLADAVPGWFQAAIAIYDADGNELAYDDHYRFRPDPALLCKIPKDGQYVLEVRDSLYRGREDFVYRIALGELPFVTSIFPLGGPAGGQTAVDLKGWNLPVHKLTVDTKDKQPGIIPIFMRKGATISNQLPFEVDSLPECLEQEPNNDLATAQKITLPIIVNGRIDKPGDWDVYRFEGHAGEKIVAEVDARKLDSPLDSLLKLTDANGRQLAMNDDYGDKGAGLSTHQADSLLTATLPANGNYYLYLCDTQHKSGPEYGYRLRISAPQPDFALRVVPSSINVRAGMSVPITVYALRKDGFSGAISLALKDVPKGFTLSGGQVPANQDQVRLTLAAPQIPPDEPINICLEGRATIDGREITRSAVPAEDMMQAFIYRHLVPSKNLLVEVIGRGRQRAPLRLLGGTPVKLTASGAAKVRFSLPPGPLANQVQLALSNPPEGISIEKLSTVQDNLVLQLHLDAEKMKPGMKGNLIVDAFTERDVAAATGGKPPAAKRRVPLGTLPAIPFEVVE